VTRRAWTACGIVFVASAGTLVLEIAAGRLLASYFGVLLYTWTGIIGVILAGIALGNYLGGAVADQAGSRRTLGLVLATAGMASLAILPFTTIELLALAPSGLPVVVRVVLITAARTRAGTPPGASAARRRSSSTGSGRFPGKGRTGRPG
jgi:hypothetical protein